MTEKAKIKKIAQLRDVLAKTKVAIDAQQDVVDQLSEVGALKTLQDSQRQHVNDLDDAVAEYKGECVKAYEDTDKKEYPGGQVKQVTKYSYESEEALQWALDHNLRGLVSLNTSEFNKACKSVLRPSFVGKVLVPTFYMDSDLSKFL